MLEPELIINKDITPNSTGDAGDTFTVTLDIAHSVDSDATAYDVDLSDILPTGMNYV